MVSPELAFTVLAAVFGAVVSSVGVWFAGVRRGDKADARILALENEVREQKERVDKLWNWMQRERGKSERLDVPAHPNDTRG